MLCGDFNCGPSAVQLHNNSIRDNKNYDKVRSSSAVFELLREGALLSSHPEHPDAVAAAVTARMGRGAGISNPDMGNTALRSLYL